LTVHIVAALGLLGASTVLVVGSLHADTILDRTECAGGKQAVTLLTAATLGVFKGSARARRPRTGVGGRNR
jgi:hypothetical protein